MPALVRRPVFWLAVMGVIVIACLGVVLIKSPRMNGLGSSQAQAAVSPPSPYVAVAEGKADVEGGVISVAARTSGIVSAVYVQEGDTVVKGQILARQEDDAPRLAVQTAEADLKQAQAQIGQTQVQMQTAQREYERVEPLAADKIVAT